MFNSSLERDAGRTLSAHQWCDEFVKKSWEYLSPESEKRLEEERLREAEEKHKKRYAHSYKMMEEINKRRKRQNGVNRGS